MIRNIVKSASMAAALITLVGMAGSSNAGTIAGNIVGDENVTPNFSTGTGKTVPLFAFNKPNPAPYQFNRFYSILHMKWQLNLPAELVGTHYTISAAKIVLWQAANQTGENWNPAAGQLKLFATGVSGANGFTTATWTESQPYIGPSVSSATPLQDPYFMELGTQAHAEDNLSAAAWATGVIPPQYDGSSVPTEAFPITFNLDVNNPEVQAKLVNDLNNGYGMWSAGGTFFASEPGGPAATYPRIVTKEGASDTTLGTLQQAPTLLITIVGNASAANWNLY